MELYFSLSGLLIAITSTTLGLFVYLKNRKSQINKTFALFCLSVSAWSWCYVFWPLAEDSEKTLFWFRMLHIGSIFISITYFHFIVTWLNLYQKKKKELIFGYLLAFFFLFFVFSPLFIRDMVPKFSMRFWAEPGILYHFYLLMFFTYALYSFYLLFVNYKKTKGIQQQQIKYFLIGIIIAYIGGSTNYFLWYNINLPPYGNVFGVAYVAFSAYAIVKYRLMDPRLVFGRTAVYLSSFTTVITVAFSLMFLNTKLPTPIPINIAYGLILIIAVLLFQPIFRFYEGLASKYFYYTFYSYQKVITDLGEKLTGVLELKTLTALIADTLINTMKLDRSGVLLRDAKTGEYEIQKITGFKEENGISLVRDNFLTNYLEKTRKPLVYEELGLFIKDTEGREEKKQLEKLQANMEKIEARLCLPLFRENKITGMLVLGGKISKEPYSEQDLELLINLSNQASVALENARLYNVVQDLSQNLQKKVDEQTKKIQKAYLVEKKARTELQRLDDAKNQFIMASQHHLRTPLTSMRGYVDLILTGSYGKVNPRVKEAIVKFQASTSRLIRIVNEFLDISQFQLGKKVILLKPGAEIDPILEEIIEELKFEAKTKGLYLKLQKPKRMTKAKADPEKLKVALFNIVDNALKYTKKGGVLVKMKVGKDKIMIIIKDTGMGIAKEDVGTLFNRFFERGKEAKKAYTTGRGIGLFITSQIVKAHKGKIWAESKGVGKGSTFNIELPYRR